MKVRLLAAFAVVAVVGCGAAPDAPQDVVALYFRSLGRDPIRSAALVTTAFHESHGLRIKSAWIETASEAQPFRLSGAELAWLGVQRRPEFFAYAPRLSVSVTEVRNDDAQHAAVTTRVAGTGAPPFTQRFFLLRSGPGDPWRIDRIEQQELVAANKIAAFVANPSRADGRAMPPAGP